jgi:hypothetical protein
VVTFERGSLPSHFEFAFSNPQVTGDVSHGPTTLNRKRHPIEVTGYDSLLLLQFAFHLPFLPSKYNLLSIYPESILPKDDIQKPLFYKAYLATPLRVIPSSLLIVSRKLSGDFTNDDP